MQVMKHALPLVLGYVCINIHDNQVHELLTAFVLRDTQVPVHCVIVQYNWDSTA